MSRPTRTFLASTVLAALLLGAALDAHAESAAKAPTDALAVWMPLDPGSRWEYQATNQIRVVGNDLDRTIEMGQALTVSVEPAPDGGRLRTTDIDSQTATGHRFQSQRREWLRVGDGRIVRYRNAFVQDGMIMDADFDDRLEPAQVVLQAPLAPGRTWGVGASEKRAGEPSSGVPPEMEGRELEVAEVVGIEDVTTPAGTFAGCVNIAYRGAAEGGVEAASADVIETRLEWFAPHVGVVKRSVESATTIRLPDGSEARMTQRTTDLLTSYRIGGQHPAAKGR
jgi:hypothetical protein